MAITLRGYATGSGTGASYSVSLTSLTGGSGSSAQAGDLVLVITGWASTTNGDPGVNTSGYTEIADLYANDTRDANLSVSHKVMGETPDTSVEVRSTDNAANGGATLVYVFAGVDGTTPIDVTTTTATAGNAARANAPSITPSTAGAWIVACMGSTGDATPTAFTGPSGMSDFVQQAGTGTTMSFVASGALLTTWTSGAYDPAALTGGESTTSDSWAAATVALRPGAVAVEAACDEAASASDEAAAGLAFSGACDETANAQDSASAAYTAGGVVSEAGNASDSTDGTLAATANIYWVITPAAQSAPTAVQVVAGQDANGDAAVAAGSDASPAGDATGFALNGGGDITGLTAGTQYKAHAVWYDGTTYSAVTSSAQWQTDASGQTYNESVSELASAGDQPAAGLVAAVAQSEPASASDAPAATAVRAAEQSEPASAQDSTTGDIGATTYNVSVSEPASASDASAAAAVLVAASSEPAAAADQPAVALEAASTVSEPAAATDAPDAAAVRAASVSEPAAAADTLTGEIGAKTVNADLSESASASDSLTTQLAAAIIVSEQATAGDTITTTAIVGGQVFEAVSAADLPNATAVMLALLAEPAAAVDAPSTSAGNVLLGEITEQAAAQASADGVWLPGVYIRQPALLVAPRRQSETVAALSKPREVAAVLRRPAGGIGTVLNEE